MRVGRFRIGDIDEGCEIGFIEDITEKQCRITVSMTDLKLDAQIALLQYIMDEYVIRYNKQETFIHIKDLSKIPDTLVTRYIHKYRKETGNNIYFTKSGEGMILPDSKFCNNLLYLIDDRTKFCVKESSKIIGSDISLFTTIHNLLNIGEENIYRLFLGCINKFNTDIFKTYCDICKWLGKLNTHSEITRLAKVIQQDLKKRKIHIDQWSIFIKTLMEEEIGRSLINELKYNGLELNITTYKSDVQLINMLDEYYKVVIPEGATLLVDAHDAKMIYFALVDDDVKGSYMKWDGYLKKIIVKAGTKVEGSHIAKEIEYREEI